MKNCKQIAIEWGLSERTINDLCKKGKITTLKYGNSWLINVDELYAFFQGGGERK